MRIAYLAHLIVLAPLALAATAQAAAPRIEFELATESGFPLTGARRWIEVFREVGQTNVRIRGAERGDELKVENRGSEASPRYHVLGVLTDRNRLRLPGGKTFSLSDRAGISEWITALEEEGIAGLTATRVAFGLTSEQLVAFHERLAKPIGFKTKRVRSGDVVRQIVHDLKVEFEVTRSARRAFGRNEPVLDELHGLSSGTALAAALRPLGLVAAPQKVPGSEIELRIAAADETDESWPIGWPPQDSPYKIAPALFKQLNVEIADTPLSEAIDAIQPRVDLPFLYDHNAMARHRIDPAEVEVSFPKKRVSYKKVLDNVLFQAQLTSKLRTDDAGTPFLWISSTRR